MMKMRKTFLALGTGVLLSWASLFDAFALNTRISFSDPSTSVGSEVNVVMKVSSVDGADIGDSVIELKYNTEFLDFVSGTNAQEASSGMIKVVGKPGESNTEYVYNIKFNALKAGESKIIVENWGIHDTAGTMATLDHRGESKVTVSEQAASDAPESNGIEPTAAEIAQTLAPGETSEGETASLETLAGEPVQDATGEGSDGTNTESGIVVERQSYELATDFDASLLPPTFEKQEYDYKGQRVSAGVQADNPAKLMYLLTNDGSGNLFFYDESNDKWSKYVNFTVASKAITVVPTTKDVVVPVGFKETTLDLNGNMVKGYIWESDTEHNYVIIYGMNAAGERHFYRYDLKEKTIQRYFEDPSIRGNTADYSDTVTYYRNLKKAYETRGTKLYIAAGTAAVLLLALIGLLLKLFVLDKKEERDRKERKRIRDNEVALGKEAARKEIESLTSNLGTVKKDVPATEPKSGDAPKEGHTPDGASKAKAKTGDSPEAANNPGDPIKAEQKAKDFARTQPAKESRRRGKYSKSAGQKELHSKTFAKTDVRTDAKVDPKADPKTDAAGSGAKAATMDGKIPEIENWVAATSAKPGSKDDKFAKAATDLKSKAAKNDLTKPSDIITADADSKNTDALNFGNVNFMASMQEIESLYPDTDEEERSDEISDILDKEEENTPKSANYDTEDAFLFDRNASLTVSFVDDDAKKSDASNIVPTGTTDPSDTRANLQAGASKLRDKGKAANDTVNERKDEEELPAISNLINLSFKNEYYEDSDDYTPEDMDEISDRLNKNLGIDDSVLELESLEENLVREYDNHLIETVLDESAKTSAEDYMVPIEEDVFKKAVKNEEKQNDYSKFDTQEIDR